MVWLGLWLPLAAPAAEQADVQALRITRHAGDDDLISAGLGLDGLRAAAPAPADPLAPSAAELRRLAIYSQWRGLAALNGAGGVGGLWSEVAISSGREVMAFRLLPGHRQPARVLLQLPDRFNPSAPCLVVAPASGSRGVYGAVPLVAPWALPRGCAVVYTDKGAGTDFYDYADNSGVGLDGRRANAASTRLGFHTPARASASADEPALTIAMPHAHSGDHPEAAWGDFVLDAVEFGLQVLPELVDGPLDRTAVRVIAAGLSNGGGAVLQAVERDRTGLIDAAVALMPNIALTGQPQLYEWSVAAALYQPCLLADRDWTLSLVFGNPVLASAGQARCAELVEHGLLEQADPALARARLLAAGFDEPALSQAAVNVTLDLWRSVAVTYASAYLRRGAADMPCGYGFSAAGAERAERQSWWASHSGIAPAGGIGLVDRHAKQAATPLEGLICLGALIDGESADGQSLRQALVETRVAGAVPAIPVLVLHGRQDGLIPWALTSRPWVEAARNQGGQAVLWTVSPAQHFDTLLNAPAAGSRYVPMLPYGWRALDHIAEVLDGDTELGPDRTINAKPAGAGGVLNWSDLGLADPAR